jgi:GxxExxY protein
MKFSKKQIDDLVYQVNGAAIEVHKALGPGLLESIYHDCMKHELYLRDIRFSSEHQIPVEYKGFETTTTLRCDLLVEDLLIVELKAVNEMLPIFQAQLFTYMKLLQLPKGLMINFNVRNIFHEGQKTYVNELYYDLD